MVCPTCGSQNADQARYCNSCGATLHAPVSRDAETVTSPPEDSRTLEVTPNDQLVGRSIDGRYRIESLIGVGGMGSVYRATRVLIGDEVAIKILHTERVTDPHAAERFRREAQAAARLKHPNAVSIYDFGISSDGLQYLVMELIEGQSLREVMKQQGALSAEVAAEVTAQVCAALDEAHRQHIVHRDVKPDNITLNSTPTGLRVKVLDFGIAKLRDETASHLTQTGSVMGTPHYMSPEQCLGEELDARADIYSMGIVLYEMLCGRVPFNSPVSTAVVVQHVNQPPPSLRSVNAAISPQVEAVVLHALQKTRDARPPTAGSFARALSAATHQMPLPAPTYPGWPQTSSPLPPISQVNEETLSHSPAAAAPRANEMPATVYLPAAQSSGATPPVRSTVPSGTINLKKGNNRLFMMIGGAIVVVMVLGLVIGMVAWNLARPGKSDDPAPADRGNTTAVNTPPAGMVYVSGGDFTMGNDGGDLLERPAHRVTVQPFFIDI